MHDQHIVIVTGMSGAGKTTVVSVFDDLGYHVIDNFPSELLVEFIKVLEHSEGSQYDKVVLGVNITDFNKFYTNTDLFELKPFILFLDATDDELIRRYRYSRRIHPNIRNESTLGLNEAINLERKAFNEIRELAHRTIDTTGLNRQGLIEQIESTTGIHYRANVKIVVQSFGFRYGIPMDTDYLFDVRFLQNPFYFESLKRLTGLDQPVVDQVLSDEKSGRFLTKLLPLVELLVTENLETDKGTMNVSFGCTGGQHRSVVYSNYLRDHLQQFLNHHENPKLNNMKVVSFHRDLKRNVKDVLSRYGETKEND